MTRNLRRTRSIKFCEQQDVSETAEALGIEVSIPDRWRKRHTRNGEMTQYATLEEEYCALRIEVAELRMERDMLKKAEAYFAKNQK